MSSTAVAAEVLMPGLTDGMESGTIIAWLAEDGAHIAEGDELLEIETDKATATATAEASGVLQIVVGVGETVEVGGVIARIGERAEAAGSPAGLPEPTAAAALSAAAAPTAAEAPDGEVRASPVARRIALQHALDLGRVTGSGPGGRIVRADVERAAGLEPTAAAPPSAAPGSPQAPERRAVAAPTAPDDADGPASRVEDAKGAVTVEVPTRVQAVVARRMSQSKAEAPEFVIGVDIDMEAAIALRTELKALAGEQKPPSYNDLVVKACALALREFPRANGAYVDGRFELYEHVNVGVAVAADGVLVVPTIFHADRKSLGAIGRESRRLAEVVRDGRISPAELTGGTFTVSNLGMFGISEFIAVINPPQAAILSVGEMRRTPVEHRGEIALRHIVKAKLTCDHRIIYGADAAGFLRRVKELLQAPLAMAL